MSPKQAEFFVCSQSNKAAKWYPDAEWMQEFDGPLMYNNEITKKWVLPPYNSKIAPVEKDVKNVTINFGPQHPAAHGVLRLVLDLEGEVRIIQKFLNLYSNYFFLF